MYKLIDVLLKLYKTNKDSMYLDLITNTIKKIRISKRMSGKPYNMNEFEELIWKKLIKNGIEEEIVRYIIVESRYLNYLLKLIE